MKDIFERLRNGETIPADDPEGYKMREASLATKKLLVRLNDSADPAQMRQLLGEITGTAIDESTALFTPIYINYGKHTRIGKRVFINFGCTFLDLGGITIGDDVLIGPNVNLLSEGHPVDPAERHALKPGHIHIKRNAWIGAGATILPGITVGENFVISAGAIVTRDVPDNSVAAGVPARIIRTL